MSTRSYEFPGVISAPHVRYHRYIVRAHSRCAKANLNGITNTGFHSTYDKLALNRLQTWARNSIVNICFSSSSAPLSNNAYLVLLNFLLHLPFMFRFRKYHLSDLTWNVGKPPFSSTRELHMMQMGLNTSPRWSLCPKLHNGRNTPFLAWDCQVQITLYTGVNEPLRLIPTGVNRVTCVKIHNFKNIEINTFAKLISRH